MSADNMDFNLMSFTTAAKTLKGIMVGTPEQMDELITMVKQKKVKVYLSCPCFLVFLVYSGDIIS